MALCLAVAGLSTAPARADDPPAGLPSSVPADLPSVWRSRFETEVDRRLEVPPQDRQRYIGLLEAALAERGLLDLSPQAVLLVDRSERVQAAFVLVRVPGGDAEPSWQWLGATPVSTGRVGSFDHFRTPLGVFAHSLANPDFRAEGTFNDNHIRGYGLRGMRVFDFGWVDAERGWGPGGSSVMRLQVHATDPARLEPRLGRADSKGCIRLPATLNAFIDHHAVLDADYLDSAAAGAIQWVLRNDRSPLPWPGRYLVIVDSKATERPDWAPLPSKSPGKSPPTSPAMAPAVVASPPKLAVACEATPPP
jgi:hypothetical protein